MEVAEDLEYTEEEAPWGEVEEEMEMAERELNIYLVQSLVFQS